MLDSHVRVACEGCAPDSHMYVQPVVCEVAFVQIWVCVVSVVPLCGPGLRQLNLVLDSAFSRRGTCNKNLPAPPGVAGSLTRPTFCGRGE